MSIILNVPDFRDARGKKYELSLLLFCLLLTELKNCRRQRQRTRWLKGNWNWIPQLWKEATLTEVNIPNLSPSQSTLSRLLNKINLWSLLTRASEMAAFGGRMRYVVLMLQSLLDLRWQHSNIHSA